MYFAELKKRDIANGLGVRVSLFVSGCRHHCPGCFNEIAWDFDYGKEYTRETEDEIIAALEPYYVQGLTLLGGEPFEPENQPELVKLLRRVRSDTRAHRLHGRAAVAYRRARGRPFHFRGEGHHAALPRFAQSAPARSACVAGRGSSGSVGLRRARLSAR